MIITSFNSTNAWFASLSNALIMVIAGSVFIVNIVICSSFGKGGGEAFGQPNFFNLDACVLKIPMLNQGYMDNVPGLRGEDFMSTWIFTWLYRWWMALCKTTCWSSPDAWELFDTPTDLCVLSGVGFNHVGIVLYYHNGILTIQHGNMDGETNTFEDATKDWCEMQISLEDIQERYDGVIFAVLKWWKGDAATESPTICLDLLVIFC